MLPFLSFPLCGVCGLRGTRRLRAAGLHPFTRRLRAAGLHPFTRGLRAAGLHPFTPSPESSPLHPRLRAAGLHPFIRVCGLRGLHPFTRVCGLRGFMRGTPPKNRYLNPNFLNPKPNRLSLPPTQDSPVEKLLAACVGGCGQHMGRSLLCLSPQGSGFRVEGPQHPKP